VEAAIFGNPRGVDVPELARRATVPTTVLWARRGDFPRPLYERVFGGLAHMRIVEVDAGHLVPMERPELVVAAVRGAPVA
jgi:pimeloyl-ACP methyl ester carboxylesterase